MQKILIIEDDQIVANIYRNKLAVDGFAVEVAHDGETGLELLRTFHPQAMILDLMLPKLSGVDVIKQVRGIAEFKELPIIVFSNTYLTNTVQKAWKAGASKCLSKASCSPKHLLDIVRATLSQNAAAEKTGSPPDASVPAAKATAGGQPSVGHASQAHAPSPATLRKSLLNTFPATLASLRGSLQALIKATEETERLSHLEELKRRIHALTGNAGVTELRLIAALSAAIEALLQELHDKPKSINASTLRTLATAIDFLGTLFQQTRSAANYDVHAARILVVDDEPISRRAVVSALERASLQATAVDSSEAAYKLLVTVKFDLIFLDIDMPGMNGHELCTKLRALPEHKKTPVIFVTGISGFEARANAMMSGGTDFIAKPFLFLELAVKALVYILRGHVEKLHPARSPQPA